MDNANRLKTNMSDESQDLVIESLKGVLERHEAAKNRGEEQPLPEEYYEMVKEQIKKHEEGH